jgi:glycosidase
MSRAYGQSHASAKLLKRKYVYVLTLIALLSPVISTLTNSSAYGAIANPPSLPVARGDASTQSVYFVMTDRFANGDTSNDQGATCLSTSCPDWGYDPTSPAFYHGGDFKGLTAHLPYIKGLGFNSIWVTPPVKGQYVQGSSADYHGYWGLDFTTIDPHLGTESDFKDFVNSAHKLGLKVILDIVVNHTADVIHYQNSDYSYVSSVNSPYKTCDGKPFNPSDFAELASFPKLCSDVSFPKVPVISPELAQSKSPSFLNDLTNYHNRGNIDFSDGSTYLDGDFYGLDDLFTEKPEVLQGEINLWASWITRFNIDGFRIDTTPYVNAGFWQKFIPAVLKVAHSNGHSTFPIFGEVSFSDPSLTATYVTEQGLPSVLDFPLQAVASKFVTNNATGTQLADFFNSDDFYTSPTTSAYGLATFMGNHDMGRIGTAIYNSDLYAGDQAMLQRDELSDALLLLLRGGPILYYGDEKGMTGSGGDQAARQDMFPTQVLDWQSQYRIGSTPIGTKSAFDVKNPMEDVISSLQALVAKFPALRSGTQQVRYGDNSVFAVSRFAGRQEFLVGFNTGDNSASYTSPVSTNSQTWSVISGGASDVKVSTSTISMTLPARSWVVLKADKQFVPTLNPKKGLTISLLAPGVDFNTPHWVGVSASVPGNDFETVTFSARVPGKNWVSLGSTDRRTFAAPDVTGGLYRTYIHQSQYSAGTTIQLVATVKDVLGNTATSKILTYKVNYSN